jgi:PAS domain S-box-containing protein
LRRTLRVLLIDDSPGDARSIRELLHGSDDSDQTVDVRVTLADGIAAARTGEWDAVLLDLGLPDSHGLETLRNFAASVAEVPVVILVGVQDETLGREAICEGAQDCLSKSGLTTEVLTRTIRYAAERARAARRLSESEGRFRRLADNAPDIVYRYRIVPEPGFEYISSAIEAIVGYSAEEVLGDPHAGIRLLHPEDRDHMNELLRGNVSADGPHVHRWIHKDGHAVWIEDRHTPIRDGDGRLVAIEGVARDVTERKRAEERFRLAAEVASDLIYEWDVETNELRWHGDIDRALGFAPGEITHSIEGWIGLIHPEDRDRLANAVERHRTETGPIYEEYRIRSKDGDWRHWIDRGVPVLASSDRPRRWIGVCIDDTEHIADHSALMESEKRFRRILENASDVIYRYRVAPNPGFDYISPAIFDVAGYSPAAFYEDPLLGVELIHPEDRRYQDGLTRGAVEAGTHDVRWIHKDGQVVWIEDRRLPILDDEGNLVAIEGVARDITEWKLAAAELEDSEARYRSIVEFAPAGIITVDLDGIVTSCNEAFARLAGYAKEEVVGVHFAKLPPARACDISRYIKMSASTLRGRTPEILETTWTTSDGETREGEVRVVLLKRESRTWGAQMIVQDITERKRAQEALQASEAKYRELVEEINEVIYTIDEAGAITYVSPSVEGLLGYPPEEIVGMQYLSLAYSADTPSVEEMRDRFGRTREVRPEDFRLVAKDGSIRWVRTASRPIMHGTRFGGLRGVLIDITERKQAEEALRVSEQQHRSLFENAALGIYQTTPDGRILAANPALVRMLGYDSFEELAARNLEESGYEPETPRERFREQIEREGRLEGVESIWTRKDGHRLVVRENAVALRDEDGNVLFYEGTVEDITERREAEEARRKLEAQLRQTQKLESIGTLASGIAHEINNPLTGMINYAELISRRVEDKRLREFAEGIMSEGGRVAKIVRNLLSFSRQDRESQSPARLVDILAVTMTLVGALLRKDQIAVETDVPEDLPSIKCRSQQIQQVLLNLLTNARDALNDRYPKYDADKIVRITSRRITEERGSWVRTIVEDHGSGIPEGAIERVFDPFFTTKPRDRGTGLGLSVSYGIVRDHGGRLRAESEIGVRTRFILDLPVEGGGTEVGDG